MLSEFDKIIYTTALAEAEQERARTRMNLTLSEKNAKVLAILNEYKALKEEMSTLAEENTRLRSEYNKGILLVTNLRTEMRRRIRRNVM